MLSIFQGNNFVSNVHYTLLTYRNNLHTKAPYILASSNIDVPEPPQRTIWLRGMHLPRSRVHVWELAARSPAGDGELVGSDPDFLPGIFCVRFWSGNWCIN